MLNFEHISYSILSWVIYNRPKNGGGVGGWGRHMLREISRAKRPIFSNKDIKIVLALILFAQEGFKRNFFSEMKRS